MKSTKSGTVAGWKDSCCPPNEFLYWTQRIAVGLNRRTRKPVHTFTRSRDLTDEQVRGRMRREAKNEGARMRYDFLVETYETEDSKKRLDALKEKNETWWESQTTFFDVQRSRAWVLVRRVAHTAHHRGQQMAMLRMLGRDLHSNYGPTADTGGLMQNHAPTIYAYDGVDALITGEVAGEFAGGAKRTLPGAAGKPVTERPDR